MAEPVDAVDRYAEQYEEQNDNYERGPSDVGGQNRHSTPGAKLFILSSVVVILIIGGALTYHAFKVKKETEEQEKNTQVQIGSTVPDLKLTPPNRPELSTAQTSSNLNDGVSRQNNFTEFSDTEAEKSAEQLAHERRLASSLNGESGQQQSTTLTTDPSRRNYSQKPSDNVIAKNLEPLSLQPSVAGILPNRDLLITEGASVPCRLKRRIDTTVPGRVSCTLVRDMYSTSGNVVLLDRQTKVVGHYQGGVAYGQERIFVTWDRAETPNGVIINLSSPGEGPLGAAGIGGYVDTHFWKRFGASIMFSLIDDVAATVTKNNGNSNNNQINFNNTTQSAQDLATEALKSNIDIPPTLYRNQGDLISIFVARDLDFRGVYELRAE